ncbi:MAG: extracellular solute-binding protein [Cyanobacteria bacterium P01_G01_bin.39]
MNYQFSRRHFLQASSLIALNQLVTGCSSKETTTQVVFLENSIPPQLIRDFLKIINQPIKVDFQPQTQLRQIFDLLYTSNKNQNSDQNTKNFWSKIFNRSLVSPGLSSLGDTWLATAIKQNLIQPLSVDSFTNWQQLPQKWQNLVRRSSQGDLAQDGEFYGAPYRWGSTVIAYRSDKLSSTPTDWKDLWQPELRDRLSLLDSPREVIGLTLKKLGESYNTDNLDSVKDLSAELSALHQQAKLYSSDHYLEPLILGDTWAAVAWSTDIIPLLKRYPEIKFVIPQSGTSLWADLWVQPKTSETSLIANSEDQPTAIEQWIDYCWQPQAAKQISLFTNGISPILSSLKQTEIPQDLRDNVFLKSGMLDSEQNEFLLPLSPETQKQYQDLWIKIRS